MPSSSPLSDEVRIAARTRTLLNVAREVDDLAISLVAARLAEEGRQPTPPPVEILDLIASWEAAANRCAETAEERAAYPDAFASSMAASDTYLTCAEELRAAFLLPLSS